LKKRKQTADLVTPENILKKQKYYYNSHKLLYTCKFLNLIVAWVSKYPSIKKYSAAAMYNFYYLKKI